MQPDTDQPGQTGRTAFRIAAGLTVLALLTWLGFRLFGGHDSPISVAEKANEPWDIWTGELLLESECREPERPTVYAGLVQPGDTLGGLLAAVPGLDQREAVRAIEALMAATDVREIRPGDPYTLVIDPAGRFECLEVTSRQRKVLRAARWQDEWRGLEAELPFHSEVRRYAVTIASSLFEAFGAIEGLTEQESTLLAFEVADVLRYDIDFFTETHPGDRVVAEVQVRHYSSGLAIVERVLAAAFMGRVERQEFVRWPPDTDKAEFYTLKGAQRASSFLKSPLNYRRISSSFGNRRHPITGKYHFHGGIDYAAPLGTPVEAVADGRVVFSGTGAAEGGWITIDHGNGYLTLYLHLSRRHVRAGARVRQGQVIGAVGSTGRSTGPHLDFRIKFKGKYVNPAKKIVPKRDIDPALKPAYLAYAERYRKFLAGEEP